jgi:hypothetical protein
VAMASVHRGGTVSSLALLYVPGLVLGITCEDYYESEVRCSVRSFKSDFYGGDCKASNLAGCG